MQRKITYYVDKIKPGQKISGFLKEKGYSEQNLVNLKKNLKSIEVNDTYVYQNYVLQQGDILNVYIRETESSRQIIPVELPIDIVYEDEDFRVILDANPAAKGHALILPKEHYANLYEIDDELAGKSMILAKKMITKLTKALGCDGYNIVQNNGEAAGQTVFHYHVHMIPRHKDDKVGLGWTMHELTEEEKEDVLSKIK